MMGYWQRTPITQIYDKLFDRIGCLPVHEARIVFEAYSLIKLVPRNLELELAAEEISEGNHFKLNSPHHDFLLAAPRNFRMLRTMVERTLAKVNAAIDVLAQAEDVRDKFSRDAKSVHSTFTRVFSFEWLPRRPYPFWTNAQMDSSLKERPVPRDNNGT